MTEETRANDVIRIYRDNKSEWRWRRRAANGEIIAVSGEGYKSYTNCVKMAREINADLPTHVVTNEAEFYQHG